MPPELPACPYPGIASFTWDDREVFFAREDEARRLIRLIVLYRGVLLYSASGMGKSSLINARVLPMALAEGFLPVRLRVRPHPGEEILAEPLPFPSFLSGEAGQRVVLPVEELLARVEALRGAEAVETAKHPLLIFDQFEEWVTLFEEARPAHDRILDALAKLLNDTQLPVKILLSLREDYLARLEPLFERSPSLSDQYVRLTPLQGGQIENVIRGPFEKHPGVWTPEISPELARELRRQLEDRAGSEGVPPPEVQIVCRRLFEAGRRGEDPEAYFASQKGVQGLLERFLEESLDALEPGLRGPAVALLARMLTSTGTRNVISRDDLISRVEQEDKLPRPVLERALAQLEEKTHLVRRELRRDVYLYEVVSEFLVDWIRTRAETLRLERVERARRRLGWIAAGLAAGLLVVAGLAVFALLSWRESERQRQLRTAQLLAEEAEDLEDRRPRRGLLLALEAVHRSRQGRMDEPSGVSVAIQTEEALRNVLSLCRGLVPGGPGRPVADAALSLDGRWLAGLGPQGRIDLWEASAHGLDRAPRGLTGFVGTLRSFDADPGGRTVAAVGDGGAVFLWRTGARATGSPEILMSGGAKAVAFAGSGRSLVAAERSGRLRLWNLRDGRPAGEGHGLGCPGGGEIRWTLSAAANRLALACDDAGVLVWSLEPAGGFREAQRLPGSTADVSALSFDGSGTKLATGNLKGAVCVWELGAAEAPPLCTSLSPASEEVMSLSFSPDGQRLAAGGAEGTTLLWEPGQPAFRPLLGGGSATPKRAVRAIAWSPDGTWVLSRGLGGYSLYRIPSKDLHVNLAGGNEISDSAFSPDGRWLVLAFANGRIEALDLTTFPISRPFLWSNHETSPTVGFSADASWLLTREGGGPARLLDLHLHATPDASLEPRILRAASPSMQAAATTAQGRWLATGETGGVLRLWDLGEGNRFRPSPRIEQNLARRGFRRLVIGPDGSRLVVLGLDDAAELWETRSPGGPGPSLLLLRRREPDITALAASPDGAWVIVAPQGRPPLLWGLATATLTERALAITPNLARKSLSPRGRWLLTFDDAGDRPLLWDLESGSKQPLSLRRHPGRVTASAFSADASWLATGDQTGTLRLWDLRRLHAVTRAGLPLEPSGERSPGEPVAVLAFSADGRWLASGSQTGTLTLEALATRQVIRLTGEDRNLLLLRFSPSGRWLAATGSSTRIWDLSLPLPHPPVVLSSPPGLALALSFDPQERWLTIASRDGVVRRWTLGLDALRDLACRWAGRNLTREEWKESLGAEAYRPTCPTTLKTSGGS